MILKYGNYAHADNECEITIDRVGQKDDANRIRKITERWVITGFLQPVTQTQAGVKAAIQAIQSAYSTGGRDLILYHNDGTTESAHHMKNADAIGSINVIKPPSFPTGRGAEYSTFRSYTIELEGEFAGDPEVGLLNFRETLEVIGTGGPIWAYKLALQGPPQRQDLSLQSTVTVIQDGSATGQFAYPQIPGPVLAQHEHQERRRVNRVSPRRTGKAGQISYEEYPVSWHYEMELAGNPGIGQPNFWTRG